MIYCFTVRPTDTVSLGDTTTALKQNRTQKIRLETIGRTDVVEPEVRVNHFILLILEQATSMYTD